MNKYFLWFFYVRTLLDIEGPMATQSFELNNILLFLIFIYVKI